MPTKQSYYRYLPDGNESRKDKDEIESIVSDIFKYKFQKALKKSPKAFSALLTLLIKGEKKLKGK
jgi:hypothetical protein